MSHTKVLISGENKFFDVLEDKEQQESYDFPAANAFEEQIRWTEEGKFWKFPIDNEQGRFCCVLYRNSTVV